MTRSHFLLLSFASSAAALLISGVAILTDTGLNPLSALLGATMALSLSSALYAWASA